MCLMNLGKPNLVKLRNGFRIKLIFDTASAASKKKLASKVVKIELKINHLASKFKATRTFSFKHFQEILLRRN